MELKNVFKNTIFLGLTLPIYILSSCRSVPIQKTTYEENKPSNSFIPENIIITGANQTDVYLPILKNKKVAVVANQTSVIFHKNGYTHLVDSLINSKITIQKVFSPEHGFRGLADANEHINNEIDQKTGLPIVSLYGNHKKPNTEDLQYLDWVVFDIQDVGVRYYTYISTLHYVMEACAENNVPLLILDRPNPNAHYIDGPTLDIKYKSFVGMHPVPLVYGMTIGEYAQMINGEKWLKNGVSCNLTIIPLKNYNHQSLYILPIKPSPNLPNQQAIWLYPSLGFFEGTPINAGRGTDFQFQRYGAPNFPKTEFKYTPMPNIGSKHPKFENLLCYGVDLSNEVVPHKVSIKWLQDAYEKYGKTDDFFGPTFTIHAGSKNLEAQLKAHLKPQEIEQSWIPDIEKFKLIRSKYLLYH